MKRLILIFAISCSVGILGQSRLEAKEAPNIFQAIAQAIGHLAPKIGAGASHGAKAAAAAKTASAARAAATAKTAAAAKSASAASRTTSADRVIRGLEWYEKYGDVVDVSVELIKRGELFEFNVSGHSHRRYFTTNEIETLSSKGSLEIKSRGKTILLRKKKSSWLGLGW